MLEQLIETIETLKARIREHRQSLADSESRTRTALIDPLLGALGWDVANPNLVQIEPKTQQGWADYALLAAGGKRVIAYVEAKKLGSKTNAMGQVVAYAVQENIGARSRVRHCVTTDGDQWVVYDVFDQRELVSASVANDEPEECVLTLLSLWRRSIDEGRWNSASSPIFAPEQETSAGNVSQPVPREPPPVTLRTTAPSPPPVTTASGGAGFEPLPEPADAKRKTGPAVVRFPDGQEGAAGNSWIGLLRATAEWLYDTGRITPETTPIISYQDRSGTFYILNRDGKQSTGVEFPHSQIGARGEYFLNVGGNTLFVVSRTRRLLEHFGVEPNTIQVHYDR